MFSKFSGVLATAEVKEFTPPAETFEDAAMAVLRWWDGSQSFEFVLQPFGDKTRIAAVIYPHEQATYLLVSWFTGRTQTYRIVGTKDGVNDLVLVDDTQLTHPMPKLPKA
jgi:hypothetical protein